MIGRSAPCCERDEELEQTGGDGRRIAGAEIGQFTRRRSGEPAPQGRRITKPDLISTQKM